MTEPLQIHLIGNAHLDPVWLWDRYEGLNEALSTVRSILDLMDAYPEMTFIRGEALVYEQVERWDPDSFLRIREFVKSGRWDIVGGNWIQPDTNLAGTATLLKEYELGMRWFEDRFQARPTCAWAADSFGHSAGYPEIYTHAGFDSFVFSRPMEAQLTLPSSLFWWIGPGGGRILSYRMENSWYGMERDEMGKRLDVALASAANSPLRMAGAFYGLGNHGGGPSARHLEDIRRWIAAHPEVDVVHSGLHKLMQAFRERMKASGWEAPDFTGELNYCLRGCYSSSMETKLAFRKAEVAVRRAEQSRVAAVLSDRGFSEEGPDWKALCFNAFHDILPGTSVEAATRQQIQAIGRIIDQADDVVYENLMRVATGVRIDTPDPWPADHPLPQPVLLWNPHAWENESIVDLEVPLDYRPIKIDGLTYENIPLRVTDDKGNDLPFQRLCPHNAFYRNTIWRMRLAVRVTLPPLGFRLIHIGWWPEPCPEEGLQECVEVRSDQLVSKSWKVGLSPSGEAVSLWYRNQLLFGKCETVQVLQVKDNYGSWGGNNEHLESENLQEVVSNWRIVSHHVLEEGPLRSRLWTCWQGNTDTSRLELTFSIQAESAEVVVEGKVFWVEREGRLKIQLPAGDSAIYEVPGGTVQRGRVGEVPGLGYCQITSLSIKDTYGVVNDGLSNFNLSENGFQATVVRSTQYACNELCNSVEESWKPVHDQGELRFKLAITGETDSLWKSARQLESPVVTLPIARMDGSAMVSQALVSIQPSTVELIHSEPEKDVNGAYCIRLTLLNHGVSSPVTVDYPSGHLDLGPLASGAIMEVIVAL